MMTNTPRWSVRITHEPAGLEVIVDSRCFRSEHKAYKAGISLMRSRIWAQRNGIKPVTFTDQVNL